MRFLLNHITKIRQLRLYSTMKNFLFSAAFLVFFHANSQSIPESFKKTTDSLISAAPQTYQEINAALKPNRRDTLLMRYFSETTASAGYFDGQTYALNQLGRKQRDISQFSKALELHQKALDAARKAKNKEFEIYSLNMISVIFRKTDAIKSSLDYSQKAIELAETIQNPSTGIKRSINVSLNTIGNIYQILGQYEQAIEKFKQSLKLELELGNNLGLAINHQNIGECYEAEGKLDEALQNFKTSLSFNEKIQSESGKIICKYSIAHVYVHQGKEEEALLILKPLLYKALLVDDKDIIASVRINLGWTLMHLERYNEAKKQLSYGLQIAKKYSLLSQEAEANKFLSDLSVKQGDYKNGLAYYRKAKSTEGEIASGRNIRYVNDMITRYETEKRSEQMVQLAEENENVKLELRRNRTTVLIAGIAMALLMGILYILYRQYQLKNEKKLLTLEQSMLRSQMNPHFLFNSLNSIKLYIINNEKKNAVYYLNKFSKLVRKILEASSLKEIPLAEELETIELYMNIENIRFSNEINFKIDIEEGIDAHNVKIPSLILQPFLENALWHGLSSKDGEKNIQLNVEKGQDDGFILISIADNGIGRLAAEQIKENKVLKRKSVGIDITKERLSNFSRDYLNSFKLEIIDLFNDFGESKGTKIVLEIPTI